MSKGSARRPAQVSQSVWEDAWVKTFLSTYRKSADEPSQPDASRKEDGPSDNPTDQ